MAILRRHFAGGRAPGTTERALHCLSSLVHRPEHAATAIDRAAAAGYEDAVRNLLTAQQQHPLRAASSSVGGLTPAGVLTAKLTLELLAATGANAQSAAAAAEAEQQAEVEAQAAATMTEFPRLQTAAARRNGIDVSARMVSVAALSTSRSRSLPRSGSTAHHHSRLATVNVAAAANARHQQADRAVSHDRTLERSPPGPLVVTLQCLLTFVAVHVAYTFGAALGNQLRSRMLNSMSEPLRFMSPQSALFLTRSEQQLEELHPSQARAGQSALTTGNGGAVGPTALMQRRHSAAVTHLDVVRRLIQRELRLPARHGRAANPAQGVVHVTLCARLLTTVGGSLLTRKFSLFSFEFNTW